MRRTFKLGWAGRGRQARRCETASGAAFLLLATAVTLGATNRPTPLGDAVAAWHMADARDSAGVDSGLSTNGAVKLGVALEGHEREASILRGGDGKAAQMSGGHLLAGQG